MRTTIYVIRHADVENPRRVLYGHLPGFPLSSLGRAQAEALGDRLSGAGIRRIVHSPLDRAAETARIVNSRMREPVSMEVDPALREADFSRYLQGVPYWQIPMRRPLWFVHKTRRGLVAGDESYDTLGGRVLDVVKRLAREHPGEPAAVISHADPIQAAWILLEGRAHNEREMYRKAIDRAGTLKIELDEDVPVSWEYLKPPEVARSEGAAA